MKEFLMDHIVLVLIASCWTSKPFLRPSGKEFDCLLFIRAAVVEASASPAYFPHIATCLLFDVYLILISLLAITEIGSCQCLDC